MNTQSRHNRFKEKCELLNFERYCMMFGVEGYVEEAFYDSQANLCIITTTAGADLDAIRNAAALSLTQFEVDGWIGHKADKAKHLLEIVSARAEGLKGN